MQAPKPAAVIEFGPFVLDNERGELRKSGIKVSLAKQPLQILQLLLAARGETVGREELVAALWPEGTFVDFEHGLNAAVNKLRQVLADTADNPRYIETVSGKGYRFIGPLRVPEPDRPAGPVAPAATEAPAKPGFHAGEALWKRVALGAVVVASGLALWMLLRDPRPGPALPPAVRFQVLPPEGHTLEPAISRIGFALSHDGRRLVFTAKDEGGLFSAWIRDLAVLTPRKIRDSAGAFSVFWGERDESLMISVRGELRQFTPDAGTYKLLVDLPGQVFSGALIAPDRLLLSSRRASIILSPGKSSQQKLDRIYSWPEPLPGGRFLYSGYDPKTDRSLSWVVEASAMGNGTPLVESDSRVQMVRSVRNPDRAYLIYVRNGSLLAHPIDPNTMRLLGDPQAVVNGVLWQLPSGAADFSASDTGVLAYQEAISTSQLVLVDRKGQVVQPVSAPGSRVKFGRLSRDGRRAAAMLSDAERGRMDIWVFDLVNGGGRRWTAGPGVATSPVWSPDARRIAYGRAVGGPPRLFMRDVDDDKGEQNLNWGDYQMPTDWSPDGRFVVFTNTAYPASPSERTGDVWVMDLSRNNAVTPLLQTPFHETYAAFSPDGKSLAFLSNDSGRTEAYVQQFVGGDTPGLVGPRRQVSRNGALFVRWRGDGQEILTLGADSRIYATRMTGTSPGNPEALFRIDPEALSVLPNPTGFDVTSDGQRFLVPVIAPGTRSALTVIQNWESLLPNQGKR